MWNEPFERKLLKHVEEVNNPIVLIWLGICEITKKQAKYASFRDYPFQHIENTLTDYRTLRDKIKRRNESASVHFIECPYYSIARYNKAIALREKGKLHKVESRGRDLREKITDNSANVRYTEGPNTSLTRTIQNHIRVHRDRNNNQRQCTSLTRTVRFNTHSAYSGREHKRQTTKHKPKPTSIVKKINDRVNRQVLNASEPDKKLGTYVEYYNQQIKLVNSWTTPRFSQDVIASSKGRHRSTVGYTKNWNLHSDGIHPSRLLSRLWLFRLIELAVELAEL